MQSELIVSVIGQGYVGLPLSVAAAESGLRVTGLDVDRTKVEAINSGVSPIEDVSDLRLTRILEEGKYRATCDFQEVHKSNIVVICVPTPLDSNLQPDLSALENATNSVAPHISEGTLIINESTSFPGTLKNIIRPIIKLYSGDMQVYFASAPERINPGDPNWNISNTPRLVGGIDLPSANRAKEFYGHFCDNIVITETPEVAEAAKILENTFRLLNIALLHELNQVFDANGIDINSVIDAASTKPYGYMPFRSGVGIGGHCIPVDPLYLTWWARQSGIQSNLIELASHVSRSMPSFVANKAMSLIKSKDENPKVLILGVAYKPGISDTRESPILELMEQIDGLGATVYWHDPLVESLNGSKGVSQDFDCGLAILATNQPGISIDYFIRNKIPVLDCTNSFRNVSGVTSL